MWNPFDFGGYLIYSGWPRLQVFIDGRNDTVYTNAFYLESFFAERSPAALARVLDSYGIAFAVVRTSYTRRWPHTAERWVAVHTDPVATVLVKETAQTCAYLVSRGHACSAGAIGAARD